VLNGLVDKVKDAVSALVNGAVTDNLDFTAQDTWLHHVDDLVKSDMKIFDVSFADGVAAYTVQRHFIGKSAQDILNIDVGDGRLLRWAIVRESANAAVSVAKDVGETDLSLNDRICFPMKAGTKPWLHFEGVQPIGTPGASNFDPGVYVLVDKGTLKLGPQLPFRREYVLSGEKVQGTVILRIQKVDVPKDARFGEGILTPYIWGMTIDEHDNEVEKHPGGNTKMVFKSVGEEPEYIIGGIVYPADATDAHGDTVTKEDVWGLMKHYMLHGRQFSVTHHGRNVDLPIIESFQAEVDTVKGGEPLPAGAFWLAVSLAEEQDLFKDVQNGVINGWSIEGTALARKIGDVV